MTQDRRGFLASLAAICASIPVLEGLRRTTPLPEPLTATAIKEVLDRDQAQHVAQMDSIMAEFRSGPWFPQRPITSIRAGETLEIGDVVSIDPKNGDAIKCRDFDRAFGICKGRYINEVFVEHLP